MNITQTQLIRHLKKYQQVFMTASQLKTTDLPGLDIDKALVRVDNNENLLIDLLIDFSDNYTNSPEQILDYLSAPNELALKSLITLTHTIKGLSAGIGLLELSHLAAKIEAAAKQQNDIEIRNLQPDFKAAMQIAQNTINTVKTFKAPDAEKRAYTAEELATHLKTLQQHIDSDFSVVDETLKLLEEFNFDEESLLKFKVIKNSWKTFDTSTMRESLNEWLNT
ncbi:hypothetical protein FLL45_14140 [Aliikangiella marina]|uniref:HPt domain-containing protein n=1 Tax=Aliikangiella marina TaxID=1712262 RepID=A0A545T9V5_9GAMM|nr:Hpt domain-containing protein [Aliikangiella marina]TQV73996.1 hypothetical protein FLL45_14140 [Aliikangiella marina]